MKTVQEIMNSIEYNEGECPRNEIDELAIREDESRNFLIQYLQNFKSNYENYIENNHYWGHIYATYLLAQFKEKILFNIYLDLIKLPEKISFNLYGDTLVEDSAKILASVYDGQLEDIKKVIEDIKINSMARSECAHLLVILTLNNKLNRTEIVEYFKSLLEKTLKDRNIYVITSVVKGLIDLYPDNSFEVIKMCFANEEVDEFLVSLKEVDDTLKLDKEDVLDRSKGKKENSMITNAAKIISSWASFKDDEPLNMEEILKICNQAIFKENFKID